MKTLTRTHFGLLGAMQSELNAWSQLYYVTLQTAKGEQRTLEMSPDQYTHMQRSLESLTMNNDEWAYVLVLVDDQDYVCHWSLFSSPYTLDYLNRLYEFSYSATDVVRLMRLIQGLSNVHLKSFLWALFAKESLAVKFVSVKGSQKHHHAYPGGLLNHSLECAKITKNALLAISNYPAIELELAITAALLHDIGKVQTHSMDGNLSQEGYSVPHDVYTLKLLTPEIEQLKSQHLQLGIGLEYLLTWKEGKGFPRLESANIIKAADRISTAYELKQQAFAGKPDHFHFAPLNNENQRQVFHRLN